MKTCIAAVAGLLMMTGCGGPVVLDGETEVLAGEAPPAAKPLALTDKMLEAARTNDPTRMAAAVGPLDVCPATMTCPSGVTWCSSWSALTPCGSEWCGPSCHSYDPFGRLMSPYYQYRTCYFVSQGPDGEWATKPCPEVAYVVLSTCGACGY